LEGQLAPWVEKTEGVVIRKIDIVNWESEAFKQASRDYGIGGIPYIRVYDKSGKLLGEVSDVSAPEVQELVKKGL
jgi:hypothetical protein